METSKTKQDYMVEYFLKKLLVFCKVDQSVLVACHSCMAMIGTLVGAQDAWMDGWMWKKP